jgi:AcrR family transcriptional regulator
MHSIETRRMRQTQVERVAESSQRLLAAAIEVIAEKGYGPTTAAEISEHAGYSAPMVRARYGSKQGLLESILRTVYDPWLFAPDNSDLTGLEQLNAQLSRLEDTGQRQPELMRFFLVLSFECVSAAQELKPWMQSFLARYSAALESTLRQGQRDGSVDASIDPSAEAKSIVSDGIGLAYIGLIASDNADFVVSMRRRREALTERLRARPRSRRATTATLTPAGTAARRSRLSPK